MTLYVVASCRKHGAIGIFEEVPFIVYDTSMTTYKDDWFSQYGNFWELNHFVSVTLEMSTA